MLTLVDVIDDDDDVDDDDSDEYYYLVIVAAKHGSDAKVEAHAVDNEPYESGCCLQNRIIVPGI